MYKKCHFDSEIISFNLKMSEEDYRDFIFEWANGQSDQDILQN